MSLRVKSETMKMSLKPKRNSDLQDLLHSILTCQSEFIYYFQTNFDWFQFSNFLTWAKHFLFQVIPLCHCALENKVSQSIKRYHRINIEYYFYIVTYIYIYMSVTHLPHTTSYYTTHTYSICKMHPAI